MLLDVEGMKCGACVRAVERTLLAQPGVKEASVNLVTRSAWLRLENESETESEPVLDQVLAALDGRGFQRSPVRADCSQKTWSPTGPGGGGSSGDS